MAGFVEAIESFFDQLTSIEPLPLALAISCHLGRIASRSAAAEHRGRGLPGVQGPVAGHLLRVRGGIGANALLLGAGETCCASTSRGTGSRGSSYPTLASSLLAETIFDSVVGVLLLTWALSAGVLPGTGVLPTWRASTGSGSSTTLVVGPGSSS